MRRATSVLAIAAVAAVSAVVVGLHFAGTSEPPAEHVAARVLPEIVDRHYEFPLRMSSDKRYLVDRRGRPFLLTGDSPQAIVANVELKDAETYLVDRRRAGFNALWIHVLCAKYTGCRKDGTTIDGIRPFTKPGDLSTPNPRYFARVDAVLRLARKARMAVFLDPIETGGWLQTLRANGLAKDRSFGMFLGRRYRRFDDIVWSLGNDFQSWRNRADDELVLAVARGIRAVNPSRLMTIELNYPRSASLDDRRWRGLVQIDSAYTHHPTYAKVLSEYLRADHIPVVMAEAGYEYEQNGPWMSKGTPETLRRQEYWSALSGAAGQFYGNHYTWQFLRGWKDHIDTLGSAELGYLVDLFAPLPWYRLIPDHNHRVVTAGYGRFATEGNATQSNYVAAAYTSDGRLAIAYLPTGRSLTVDAGRLRRPLLVRWFDPTVGRFRASRRTVTAPRDFRVTPPALNADKARDWVLVVSSQRTA